MSRYACSWDAALSMPLVRVHALYCVGAQALGMEPAGPDYGERAMMATLDARAAGGAGVKITVRKHNRHQAENRKDHGRLRSNYRAR